METNKIISGIIVGVIIGAITGIGGMFYSFNSRLVTLEIKIDNLIKSTERIKKNKSTVEPNNKITIFSEVFNDNVLGWDVGKSEGRDISISNGKLVFNQTKDKWIGWTRVDLPILPEKYKIELTCAWISGDKSEPFGLFIGSDEDNYFLFGVTESGYIVTRLEKNSKILNAPTSKKSIKKRRFSRYTVLSLNVSNDTFEYYVNSVLLGKGYIGEFNQKSIGVFVTDKQKVEFDRLIITE